MAAPFISSWGTKISLNMPKAKKKTGAEVPVSMDRVIEKLLSSSYTRFQQIIQSDVVQMFEEEYKWAEELLEEVKQEFTSPASKINLLPKTPSAKRKRQIKRQPPVIEENNDITESMPSANATDANILAYETPPQHGYRTRASSRTTQTKRTTRAQTREKKVKEQIPSAEDVPPILNFNQSKEISSESDNVATNVLLQGGISNVQPQMSHVFSPPIGKPGKGHVKEKVHAYEEYIEHSSPSSRQVLNQSSVPDTPDQKEVLSSSESCRETPEASYSKRQSIRKSLKSKTALRKSLLKSSQVTMNPGLLHTSHNKETPKQNKLKLRKKATMVENNQDVEKKSVDKDIVESSSKEENSCGQKLDSEEGNFVVDSCESGEAVNVNNGPEPSAESDLEAGVKESEHEQVQRVEQMEVEQEPKASDVEQSSEERQDVSVHSAAGEPLSSSRRESDNSEPNEAEMKECENVRSVEVTGSDGGEKRDIERIVPRGEEKLSTTDDSDEEVVLISDDEETKPSAVCKQKTDSVTQADDESEGENQESRSSKRTKQRKPPKPEKSESESDTEVSAPKRTKQRKPPKPDKSESEGETELPPSKWTKQRHAAKSEKSESESETEVPPPKRTRTKTRKVLENELVEATKPVRQSSRTKQRKQEGTSVSSANGSDTNSEVDSGHGSLNSGSSRSTRSKMRKHTEGTVPSDEDSKFAVPENPAPKSRTTSKRTLDTDSEGESNTSLSKKSRRDSEEDMEVRPDTQNDFTSVKKGADTDEENERNSQSEDETPDTIRHQAQIVKPVSFRNNLCNKVIRPGGLNVSGIKSFLHQNTPPTKVSLKERQEQRKRELEEKKRKEAEILQKREWEKKKKIEELRKKREERMRRVNERREQANREDMESKSRMIRTIEEKSKQADDLKEEKMKEEQERQRLRLKKLEEAEERRRQEEEERTRKLREQEEMEQRNMELMQRKKEFEEQERQKKKAEERRKFEERMAEFERERVAEHERLKRIEEEKIRERQKLREERERQLAKERAERERLDMEKRKQKDLELKQKMEKIKELEKKRMMEEERRRQELKERERAIQSIVIKHNMAAHTVPTGLPKPNLNSTLTVEQPINSQEKMPNPDSYEMTPAKTCFPKKASLESYDISDLHSDDSTDEDEAPKKKVPTWALGASLKAALIQQHYHPPDLNLLFTEIEPPDLNELFVKKKARFNKRTSSAIWNSPILKPGLN